MSGPEWTGWDEPEFWDGETFPKFAKLMAMQNPTVLLVPCPRTVEELNKYEYGGSGMKDPWDYGHSGSLNEDDSDLPSLSEAMNIDRKAFIDPAKMAERKEITDARVEGWQKGQKHGFNRGLAWGIGGMVLFYSTVAALLRIIS